VSRGTHGGASLLTASERRIADLAVAGASNAEIAQSLFVTVKTVEFHLTNIYRKLRITKRAQLGLTLHTDRPSSAADEPARRHEPEPVVTEPS
jgi:DNA-binding CsgD family transcriptional regulator